jgi:chemotaxis protein CheD
MWKSESLLPEIYLQPGEAYLAETPTRIRTLLGSCVGITFWCARNGLGALGHPMLPVCPSPAGEGFSRDVGRRYVDFTIRDLAQNFDARGVARSEIEVKLFGGADVLLVPVAGARPTVGRLNWETAMGVLAAEGLSLTASSLGGTTGVSIQFNTLIGEVRLKRLI